MDMRRVVSGVALRTLATRGRKREGPTPKVWEGWSEAEGPKDNTACGPRLTAIPITPLRNLTRFASLTLLEKEPDRNTAYATPATLLGQLKKEGDLKSF